MKKRSEHIKKKCLCRINIISIIAIIFVFQSTLKAQTNLISLNGRNTSSLDGKWAIIIDPYETGYYNYRYEVNPEGYFKNSKPQNKWDLIEYSFEDGDSLIVPGDWNSQQEKLLLYEGTIWYKKSFDYSLVNGNRLFVHFGAVNYDAKVYLNGEFLGEHQGGFTPFNFEITDLVNPKNNYLILKVDNKRYKSAVPTLNTDWFNYGGITRSVNLIEEPETFIDDYFIQLKKDSDNYVAGWIKLNGKNLSQKIIINIKEIDFTIEGRTNTEGIYEFETKLNIEKWSVTNPKLYEVSIESELSSITDKIGFRNIKVEGEEIILNGEPVYLRGICMHEEAPFGNGSRAYSMKHSKVLLDWAKELGCNFIRLAHYPHNENIIHLADSLGFLVWNELPVYWTIDWENELTYKSAENQLSSVITRDKNRASVIIWSMANETPISEARFNFLTKLIKKTKELDDTRLITAALEKKYLDDTTIVIDDPLGNEVDVIGCNSYVGWYDGLPDKCEKLTWISNYKKPVIISEFGGGALYGIHADSLTRWSEEFQEYLYIENIKMFNKVGFIKGISPWILKDFKSPRRPLYKIQDFWNRKGVLTDKGEKKKAYYILQKYYKSK